MSRLSVGERVDLHLGTPFRVKDDPHASHRTSATFMAKRAPLGANASVSCGFGA